MNIKIYREDGLDGRARQPMSAAVVEYCQMVMMSKQSVRLLSFLVLRYVTFNKSNEYCRYLSQSYLKGKEGRYKSSHVLQ